MAFVMIVDDDEDFVSALETVLCHEGYEVDVAHDTGTAVKRMEQRRPDLLVLDVMFPENPAGGFDLARAIRQHAELKDLPVILLTAVNQEFPMEFSAKDIDDEWMPVHDFVEIPVKIPVLRAMINKLLSPGSN